MVHKKAVASRTCVYCCSAPVTKKSKEHALPKSLGEFEGDRRLDCICGGCNGEISKVERALLRYTHLWFFRRRLGIQGYKHHHGNPVYDQYQDLLVKLKVKPPKFKYDLLLELDKDGVAGIARQIIWKTEQWQ